MLWNSCSSVLMAESTEIAETKTNTLACMYIVATEILLAHSRTMPSFSLNHIVGEERSGTAS